MQIGIGVGEGWRRGGRGGRQGVESGEGLGEAWCLCWGVVFGVFLFVFWWKNDFKPFFTGDLNLMVWKLMESFGAKMPRIPLSLVYEKTLDHWPTSPVRTSSQRSCMWGITGWRHLNISGSLMEGTTVRGDPISYNQHENGTRCNDIIWIDEYQKVNCIAQDRIF